jgi:subtilisin family serine protease
MISKGIWKISLFMAAFGFLISGPASAQDLNEHNMADEAVSFAPGGPIPGQYIVVLNDDVTNPRSVAVELSRAHGLGLGFTYSHAIKGFSAQVPAQALNALGLDPRVAYVEQAQRAFLVGHGSDPLPPIGIRRIFGDANQNITIDGHDDLRVDVDVAVIDSGIDLDHSDLNVVASVACLHKFGSRGPVSCTDGAGNGGYWHGTHVAGTIGALDDGFDIECTSCTPNESIDVVGIAPGARLHAVKVFNDLGSGGTSITVMAGLDWVAARIDTIDVTNMSIGFNETVPSVCGALVDMASEGMIFAVAAGNDGASVLGSPADCIDANDPTPDMFVVSAMADFNGADSITSQPYQNVCAAETDEMLATFSNYGPEVNITAPGVCVISTNNDGGHNIIANGTSMASPHVAGAAALLASGPRPCSDNPVASELPCAPTNLNGVELIVGEVLNSGNLGWADNSGDEIHEPLLDVRGTVFAPATIAGAEGGGGNTIPVAIDDPGKTTTEGAAVTIDVLANDIDGDDDLLSLWSVTQPSNGSVVINIDDTVTYTPNASFVGIDTFTYTAHDGTDESNSATVTVDVQASGGGSTPQVSGCSLTSVTTGQRTTIVVTGSNFESGATVDFGERIAVQDVTFVSAGQLDVRIRVHNRAASGQRYATVSNPSGQSSAPFPCFNVN